MFAKMKLKKLDTKVKKRITCDKGENSGRDLIELEKKKQPLGEEARRQLHKNAACNLEQVLAATPHKTPTVRPPASCHENYSS